MNARVSVPSFIKRHCSSHPSLTHLATVPAAHCWWRKMDMAAPEQLLNLPRSQLRKTAQPAIPCTVLQQLNGLLLITENWNEKDNLTTNNKGLTDKQQELFSTALFGIAAYGKDCQEQQYLHLVQHFSLKTLGWDRSSATMSTLFLHYRWGKIRTAKGSNELSQDPGNSGLAQIKMWSPRAPTIPNQDLSILIQSYE